MKTHLIATFTLIMFFSLSANSQYLDKKHIKDIKSKYLIISKKSLLFSSQIAISVDFGETPTNQFKQSCILKDETNKPIKFNSIVDALNYFYEYDYELINTYYNLEVYFILKKVNYEK